MNRHVTFGLTFSLLLLVAAGCGNSVSEQPVDRQEIAEADAVEDRGERCARHDLPVTACFICDPELRDAGRLWCREHDFLGRRRTRAQDGHEGEQSDAAGHVPIIASLPFREASELPKRSP